MLLCVCMRVYVLICVCVCLSAAVVCVIHVLFSRRYLCHCVCESGHTCVV